MPKNECIEDIIAASGGVLSRQDALDLMKKFERKRISPEEHLKNIWDILISAGENMVNENELYDIFAKARATQAVVTERKLLSKIKEQRGRSAKSKRPSLDPKKAVAQAAEEETAPKKTVKQALDSVFHGSPDSRESVVLDWSGPYLMFQNYMSIELEAAGVMSAWKDPEVVKEALKLFGTDLASVPKGVDKDALTIATILKRGQALAYRQMNEAGIHANNHFAILANSRALDSAKVAGVTEKQFIDRMMQMEWDESRINLTHNTKAKSAGREAALREHFSNVYRQITSLGHYKAPTGTYDGFSGLTKSKFKDAAASGAVDYSLPFKSVEQWMQLVEEFSDESFQSIILRRFDQIGRSVGVNKALGPTPERTILRLLAEMAPEMTPAEYRFYMGKDIADRVDSKDTKTLLKELNKDPKKAVQGILHNISESGPGQLAEMGVSAFRDAHPLHTLAFMDGTTSAPVHGAVARTISGFQAMVAVAKLHSGVFLQLTDIPIKLQRMLTLGQNPFDALINPIVSFANAMPDKEKSLFYNRMNINAETMRRNLAMELIGPASQGDGQAARLLQWGYKATLMPWWDRVQKQGAMDWLSRDLVNALENHVRGGVDQTHLLGEFRSYGFTNDDFVHMYAAISEIGGERVVDPLKLQQQHKDLYPRYLAAVDDLIRSMILTPGAKERGITLKGTSPGTAVGSSLRMFMMFKSFPIMYLTRVFPQTMYDDGIRGMLTLMTSMVAYWYLADSMKALATGKTPRDMTDPANLVYGLSRSGMGGVYSDMLFNEWDRYGLNFSSSLGGPIAGTVDDTASLISSAVKGEVSQQKLSRYASRNIPLINLWYFKTILDRTLIYGIMDMAEPGSVDQMYKDLEQRTGQQRLF